MTDQSPEAHEPDNDLEYDLAQEASGRQPHPARRRPEHRVVELPPDPAATDDAGDYGYDLAHDVPRSRHP